MGGFDLGLTASPERNLSGPVRTFFKEQERDTTVPEEMQARRELRLARKLLAGKQVFNGGSLVFEFLNRSIDFLAAEGGNGQPLDDAEFTLVDAAGQGRD